ncbi:zinc transporter 1-like [Hibiscus syriacus]|uniref:zinc transporter 1-like n=1 Tax=Hibiscus syriacus TaxID=106335 RepID=UPI001924D230|nr:zinc transporter 1-like [Hibiscus syriacus]
MIHFRETKSFTFLCCCFLTLIPSRVLGDCTCQPEDEDRDNSLALKYKMAAIASILVAGAIGVCFPPLGETVNALRPEKNLFFFIKAFAVRVILSTGFIHVLPDATENLTSPCLHENPWGKFPFAGLVAMAASIGTVMIDVFATPHYTKSHLHKSQQNIGGDEEKTEENENHLPVHTHATHSHAHGSVSMVQRSDSVQLLRHRVVSQVLELGIVVHSVIIGISLGASESPKTIRPLVAALTFHQFFEGMGLGGCISQVIHMPIYCKKRIQKG